MMHTCKPVMNTPTDISIKLRKTVFIGSQKINLRTCTLIFSKNCYVLGADMLVMKIPKILIKMLSNFAGNSNYRFHNSVVHTDRFAAPIQVRTMLERESVPAMMERDPASLPPSHPQHTFVYRE